MSADGNRWAGRMNVLGRPTATSIGRPTATSKLGYSPYATCAESSAATVTRPHSWKCTDNTRKPGVRHASHAEPLGPGRASRATAGTTSLPTAGMTHGKTPPRAYPQIRRCVSAAWKSSTDQALTKAATAPTRPRPNARTSNRTLIADAREKGTPHSSAPHAPTRKANGDPHTRRSQGGAEVAAQGVGITNQTSGAAQAEGGDPAAAGPAETPGGKGTDRRV